MLIEALTNIWIWVGSLYLFTSIIAGVLLAKVEDLERKVRHLEQTAHWHYDDVS